MRLPDRHVLSNWLSAADCTAALTAHAKVLEPCRQADSSTCRTGHGVKNIMQGWALKWAEAIAGTASSTVPHMCAGASGDGRAGGDVRHAGAKHGRSASRDRAAAGAAGASLASWHGTMRVSRSRWSLEATNRCRGFTQEVPPALLHCKVTDCEYWRHECHQPDPLLSKTTSANSLAMDIHGLS